jgi:hypothetical protein
MSHVTVRASLNLYGPPAAAREAGVRWESAFAGVNVTIVNTSEFALSQLDLVVRPDAPVVAAWQETKVGDVVLLPNQFRALASALVDEHGKKSSFAQVFLATDQGYRLQCGALHSAELLTIGLATATIIDAPHAPEVDKLLAVSFKSGRKMWYADPKHSAAVFAKRPTVRSVAIEGEYSVLNEKHAVSMILDIAT